MDKTLIKHLRHPEPGELRTIESVQVDWNEWFKHCGLLLRLYCADEQKIQKTNRAHLIKSLLSGNYLMETFALTHSDFQPSRNWQKESCLFSKCFKKKHRTRQTIGGGRRPNGKVGILIYSLSQATFALQLKVCQTPPPCDTGLMFSGKFKERDRIASFQL